MEGKIRIQIGSFLNCEIVLKPGRSGIFVIYWKYFTVEIAKTAH